MKRFLVMFISHPSPPHDMTVVDVRASCVLSALAKAQRESQVQHGWHLARAIPWPRGLVDVDEAVLRAVR